MMKRLTLALAVVLALAVAGCGGDSTPSATTQQPAAETTTIPPTTVAPTTTTTLAAAPVPTSTTVAPTTTMAPSASGPTLDDGRPATFLAITDDYRAVEVDTVSGEIVHVFGQTGTPEQMAAAEEISPNVLVGVWRVRDGSMIGLSDCCEPAAGRIFYVGPDGELGDNPYASAAIAGWTLSPSPTDNNMANLGYSMLVTDPNVSADFGTGQWLDEPELGFPDGAAAWARDGSELFWTTRLDEATALATLDLAEGAPVPVGVLSWVGAEQSLSGIGSQASGNLVGFLHTRGDDYSILETEGVVFSIAGELVANFTVEIGSTWGGYDSSGTYLIYTDADGTVRWQGVGATGELGDGFLFASW